MLKKTINKILDIFFSKNKTRLYVLIFVIVGLILRLMAANNTGIYPDDAVHAIRPIGIIDSGKLEEYGQSSVLWYYIQELFYKIFGASQLGSRMAAVFFGTLSIILSFLFTKYLFKSDKIALISSALTSLSPFFIKMMLPEMDITVMFFTIFSALFLFKFLDTSKKNNFFISAILMGVAVMIKIYAIFFTMSFCAFILYSDYSKNKKVSWRSIKKAVFFGLLVFVFFLPVVINNYLMYQDLGFMDLMFTNYFKLGQEKAKEIYGWASGYMAPTDYEGFFFGKQWNWQGDPLYNLPGFLIMLIYLFREDPIIILLGLIGLIYAFKKKENTYAKFFLFAAIPIFIYLGSQIPMQKHFTFILVLLTPLAANYLAFLDEKIKLRFPRFKLRYLLILILIWSLLWLGNGAHSIRTSIYSESSVGPLMNYKANNIPEGSLVVVDSRTFRGYIAWMFHDRAYIESSLFGSALEESAKYTGETTIDLYFIECVADDCGWGTIKNQPEFNQSMEMIANEFSSNARVMKTFSEIPRTNFYFPLITHPEPAPIYRVYKTRIKASPAILALARSTHNIMMYPIGYDKTIGPVFDDYEIRTLFGKFLSWVAHLILYGGFVVSISVFIYLFYLFIDESLN